MNKRIKSELAAYFEPPKPKKRDKTLNSLAVYEAKNSSAKNRITHRSFVFSQILYIRKWVWIVSAIFFVIVLFYHRYFDAGLIKLVSSFMPVLALVLITESGRSENCGMAELEISARFSLRYVITARLLILGLANLLTVIPILPFIFKNSDATYLSAVIHILCPYLMTSFSCLLLTRKIQGGTSAYLCVSMAAIISISNITAYEVIPYIFEAAYTARWGILIILLIAGCTSELHKRIQRSEDLSWNLY